MQSRLIYFFSLFFLCSSGFAISIANVDTQRLEHQKTTVNPSKTAQWVKYVNNQSGYEVLIPKNSIVKNGESIKTLFGDTIKLLQTNNEEFKPNISSSDIVSIVLPTITPKELLKGDYITKYLVILTLNDLPKDWSPEQIFSGKKVIVGKNSYYKVESSDSGMMQSVEGEHYFIKHANTYYVINFLFTCSHSEVSPNFPGFNEKSVFNSILETFAFNK